MNKLIISNYVKYYDYFYPQTNTANNNELHYLKKKIISITEKGGKLNIENF